MQLLPKEIMLILTAMSHNTIYFKKSGADCSLAVESFPEEWSYHLWGQLLWGKQGYTVQYFQMMGCSL